eukprot:1825409-Amphidinium_carterae.1
MLSQLEGQTLYKTGWQHCCPFHGSMSPVWTKALPSIVCTAVLHLDARWRFHARRWLKVAVHRDLVVTFRTIDANIVSAALGITLTRHQCRHHAALPNCQGASLVQLSSGWPSSMLRCLYAGTMHNDNATSWFGMTTESCN